MRFFELFIKNKNLIKQGFKLLEICQNAAGSTDLATDRRGHDGLSWTPSSHTQKFLLLLSSFPSTASMTDRQRHNGLSRVFVSKHFNSWNLGTGITSLNFMTNLQYGPSQPRRTVTSYVTPHLVRLPHLPSTASLRCHLRPSQARRTVISSVGDLFCNSSLKISAFSFGQISCKTKRNLYQNQHKKGFRTH